MALLGQAPARERVALLAAAMWLSGVDLAVRALGVARVSRVLEAAPRPTSGRIDPQALDRRYRCAARLGPWRVHCLARCLGLRRRLARGGVASRLRIGVADSGGGGLRAHAWLEVGGRPLGEPDTVEERFLPLLPATLSGRPAPPGR